MEVADLEMESEIRGLNHSIRVLILGQQQRLLEIHPSPSP